MEVIARTKEGIMRRDGMRAGGILLVLQLSFVLWPMGGPAEARKNGNEKEPTNLTSGIWISPAELAKLPMKGQAWTELLAQAELPAGTPKLSDQEQFNNVYVLAKALVYARTGNEKYRKDVRSQLERAIDTELGGRTLALGRNLAAYVIAADLIRLSEYDAAFDSGKFRPWLQRALTEKLDGRSLRSTHEDRPNNWGTHAGASRAAVAVYLGDKEELEKTARVFRGWLGDRKAYAGYKYGDLSWQCDPANPVGINPKGCQKEGHLIDGVLPDDQRRKGGFAWPAPHENYVYEALQGALVQAVILNRAGYDTFEWSDRALLRAYEWLRNTANYPAKKDDIWQLPVVDYFYGTKFWDGSLSVCGKNMCWTEWTHAKRGEGVKKSAGR